MILFVNNKYPYCFKQIIELNFSEQAKYRNSRIELMFYSFSYVLPKNSVLISLVFTIAFCLDNNSFGQCEDDTVSLGPNQYFCSEVNTILNPEIISTNSVISYYWYQNDNLIDSTSTLEVNAAGTYVWSVKMEALPSQEVKKYRGHVNLLR